MLDFFELVQKSLPTLLEGTFVTIKLTILILALGLVLGLIIAFFQTYGNKPVRLLAGIYDRIFRSVPELVLLLLVFYGLPNIGFRLSPFYAAVLALGLRSAAYMAQIFRGSFMSVGSDQLTAAYSLGMGEYKAFIYVIFPQAIRAFIPPSPMNTP
ncbi:ABC transporter permease subunit [Acetomicrobium sp.]|uniref:amino acid ABC transporter permease n=1 Tax=Acetomicrobium sp. TaxID=1872099 RepID=UPI002870F3F8|nr:ABC transporter permease subunit [Acetomicrobium sp.]MDR9769005.1 ABC transporter permease subunit [Acetomicrobium sp.]